MLKMHNLRDLQYISFPEFNAEGSFLVVYEGNKKVPFLMERLFVVKASRQIERGFHAHKECAQLLIVLDGECHVTCDDGVERKKIVLNKASEGLLIPPTIWAEQEYQPNTILMVLTNRNYEDNDYIRNYEEFLNFRKRV